MPAVEYAFISFEPSLYFSEAQENLAQLYAVGVNDCGVDGQRLSEVFVASGLAGEFERMNPVFVAGKSAIDLLDLLARYLGIIAPAPEPETAYPGADYWVGWVLVHF